MELLSFFLAFVGTFIRSRNQKIPHLSDSHTVCKYSGLKCLRLASCVCSVPFVFRLFMPPAESKVDSMTEAATDAAATADAAATDAVTAGELP